MYVCMYVCMYVWRMELFHERCLRKILGIKWQRMIPRTEVLVKAGMTSIDTMITITRLKWLGHIRRMPDHRYPKILLMAKLREGKRNPSKPKQRWKDLVKADLKKFHMSTNSWWVDSSQDNRARWRQNVYKGAKKAEDRKTEKAEEKRMKRKVAERRKIQSLRRDDGFHCEECPRLFPDISSLRRHNTATHTKPQHQLDLTCPTCERHFTSRSARTRHKCSRQGQRNVEEQQEGANLVCSICSQRYTTQSGLTRHRKFCLTKEQAQLSNADLLQ